MSKGTRLSLDDRMKSIHLLPLALCAGFCFTQNLLGGEVETFLEPYRSAAVSAPGMGVIDKVFVTEGDHVVRGQPCAKLNDEVLQSSLRVAYAAREAKGALRSAETEATTRKNQLASYRALHARGNATRREIELAESDYQQAEARLQNVREELEVRRLECAQVESQIAQRTIAAPFNGVVVAIEKERGEFVSPTDPVVLRVVQIETLKAIFSVPVSSASELRKDQEIRLLVGARGTICGGVIEYVSPIAEAKSTTIRVTVRVPNVKGEIQSGLSCIWDLSFRQPVEKSSHSPLTRTRR